MEEMVKRVEKVETQGTVLKVATAEAWTVLMEVKMELDPHS